MLTPVFDFSHQFAFKLSTRKRLITLVVLKLMESFMWMRMHLYRMTL